MAGEWATAFAAIGGAVVGASASILTEKLRADRQSAASRETAHRDFQRETILALQDALSAHLAAVQQFGDWAHRCYLAELAGESSPQYPGGEDEAFRAFDRLVVPTEAALLRLGARVQDDQLRDMVDRQGLTAKGMPEQSSWEGGVAELSDRTGDLHEQAQRRAGELLRALWS
jgi:hypothetical protein